MYNSLRFTTDAEPHHHADAGAIEYITPRIPPSRDVCHSHTGGLLPHTHAPCDAFGATSASQPGGHYIPMPPDHPQASRPATRREMRDAEAGKQQGSQEGNLRPCQ